MKLYRFNGLLLEEGWIQPCFVGVDDAGVVTYLSENPPIDSQDAELVKGLAVPGFQNAHSHAFQYAMAGLAEVHHSQQRDDFWTWREAMYRCALAMDPDEMEAIAAMLYAEMLRNGYTHVAEFHYLHNDKDGRHYANYSEMGQRLIAAAVTAGIKITLIPVFYQKGNFGHEAHLQQRRFICTNLDEYFHLLDDTAGIVSQYAGVNLGFGVHSLRAVDHHNVIATFQGGPANLPFHLHAAEQLKEVEDCTAYLERRPVQWLLENLPVDERFHVVHCTHMNDQEVIGLAASGAHVVLCPGTEGNLGDGIFRLADFNRYGGKWSLGTDSHISLNPLEDLRWLDYGQRLASHNRGTFSDGALALYSKTLASGRSAMGNEIRQFFTVGQPFDAIVYDAQYPLLMRDDFSGWLSSILYTADSSVVLGTLVNGKWVVKQGHHFRREEIARRYQSAIKAIG
ncbi:MAG: formimidoylglutamate deiminase [Chryseolinea sp.]